MPITFKAISGQATRCLSSLTVTPGLFALPLAIEQIMMTNAAELTDRNVPGGQDLLISQAFHYLGASYVSWTAT